MEVSNAAATGVDGNGEELLEEIPREGDGDECHQEEEEEEENELLKALLEAEREAQSALYYELEKERNAAATAANEAMAMITRLQEEKALAQMEARQFQRMVEEKTLYDQEAMEVLRELLARREEEKKQLEEEIRVCSMKLLTAQEDKKRDQAAAAAAAPDSSDAAVLPLSELSRRNPETSFPTATGMVSKRRSSVGRSVGRREEKAEEAEELIRTRETRSGTAGTIEEEEEAEEVPEKNNDQEEPAAGFWDKEIEEKRLSVLEYVWKFEEQLQQQGGSCAAHNGRPKSAGDSRTKVMKAQEEGRRTMCSQSSRKAEKLVSEIVEKDSLRRRLFEEEAMMVQSTVDSFSSIGSEEDSRGSGKLLLEGEESRGRDDEACGVMGGHTAAEDCEEEEDLFMQDIYEVHHAAAPREPQRRVVMQDKGDDCRGWDCGRTLCEFDSDRLGKPDLSIVHGAAEITQDLRTSGEEDAYHPDGLCDKEIRDSSTIGRDGTPVEDEVMHLTLRLKALEADRDLMKQTIESLQRENGEMKLLQEIVQQLRELRGMEQRDLEQQTNLLPIASSCQGTMSLAHLRSSTQTQLSKLASVHLGDVGPGDRLQESHVGLGHLLHTSPKSSTCITRVRRANIPSTLSAIQSKALERQQI